MRQIYTSLFKNTIVFSFLLSLLIGWNTHAQVYPVQTNVSTSGPYFNYLSYYGDQNNHLQVITTLVDFNTPPINVRLRFKIQGPGYELYTNPNANITQTYVLESGMPLVLSGIDLLPYLQANTLVNPNNVDLNNLPEGLTTICVDVIRAGTNQEVLSTNNCTLFNLYQFQPPQTFLPQCASMLDTTGLFHTFQWSAPLGYVPDVNSEVRYTFSLYRWQDPSNNTIFVTDQGLVWREYDIQTTQAIVSEFDVQFEQGGLYVWRIEAQVYSDGMPINMIVNNGVSAPCTFTYGEAQTLTDLLGDGLEIQLFTEASSERKGTASWTVIDNTPNQGLSTFDAFFIEYRKQPTGNEGFEIPWFSETLTTLQKFIYQLEPNTSYEVKVSGIIGGVVGDPTPVKIFTTPAARVYACGESDLPFLPATYTPLQNATVGTQVQIGQFTLTMTEVVPLGSAGHYAGKGEIPISFLANARAKVRFEDLLIDTEYRVREGRADVITEGLEAWLDEQYQQFIDPYFVDGTIDSAYVSDSLAWVVVDGVAISFVFDPPNYPVIVNDASGNTYTIYPNGTIIVSSYLAISETWNVGANQVAMFGQNANEIRGFDPKEHMEWYENYETMKLSDNTFYFVANKSMAKGEADQVNVQFPPNVSQMSFELANGTPILVSSLNGAWMGNKPYNDSGLVQTLNIPAFSSAGKYEIFAFANNEKVGQLNINVYSEKTKELIVVPLVANLGVTESQIKAELDRTLGEANINVTVTLSPQWNDTTFTPTYTISLPTEVGALSKYSDDMRELRDAYFAANPNAAKDKYYLFVVNGFDDPSELGYMVRGRAMGFIAGSQSNILETISHELGHGMGALEHSWKNNGPSQGSTDNLMDYGANAPKNNLTKAQWKELRDADVLPSLFDDVEDYQFVSVSMSFLSSLKEGDSYTFIRPNGSLISLPSNTQSVEFSTLDRGISDVSGSETEYLFPVGALLSFQLADGKMYSAKSSGSYYWVEDNASEYIDTITSSKNYTYAITHFTGIQNNKIVNYYFPVSQSSANELTSQANYIIFDNQNISWDLTPVQFVTSYMPQGFSGSYLNDEGNSEIQIGGQNWFNTVTYNVGNGILKNVNELTIEDLFIQAAGTEPSVKDIIHYLLFINAHRAAFDGYVQCFEDYNANELSMQDARTEQMIIRQQYIHSGNMADATAAKQAVTDFKQATVQKIVDKLIESNLSQDLSNLSGLISSQQSDGEDIHNWIATNGSCVLGGLTPYNRALGFRKLLQDDEYWDDALLMLEKINEQDYINVSTFINLLVDNPTANWLDIALVQLSDTWEADGDDYPKLRAIFDRFMGLCGGQGDNPRFASTVYTKTFYNDVNPLLSTPTTLEYTAVSQPIFFAKSHSTKYFYDGINPASPIGIKFQDGMDIFDIYYQNGKVHIVQNYEIWDGTTTAAYPGWSPPKTAFVIHYELSPYENVSVKFLENYATELGFDEGEDVVVPAYYLLFFKESIANANWHADFRLFWNGVTVVGGTLAFISAPLTAGGSLALVGAIVAATDIEVQANRMNASNAELSAFDTWDKFYVATQLLTLAPTGYNLLKAVYKPGAFSRVIVSFRSMGAKLNQLPSNIKASLVYLRNAWGGLANNLGSQIVRTLDEIAPNGIIPSNSQTNNLFHKWFDDLLPEELDLVLGNPSLKEALESRIRYPGGLHEWCMVCEIRTFKSWEVSMSEIHRFRTKTLDLTGVNPTTGATFVHGGAGSTAFHNELRTMIQSSSSLTDFNIRLAQLVNRWQIDPSLLPPLIN